MLWYKRGTIKGFFCDSSFSVFWSQGSTYIQVKPQGKTNIYVLWSSARFIPSLLLSTSILMYCLGEKNYNLHIFSRMDVLASSYSVVQHFAETYSVWTGWSLIPETRGRETKHLNSHGKILIPGRSVWACLLTRDTERFNTKLFL